LPIEVSEYKWPCISPVAEGGIRNLGGQSIWHLVLVQVP
jgi:hypothetical protein